MKEDSNENKKMKDTNDMSHQHLNQIFLDKSVPREKLVEMWSNISLNYDQKYRHEKFLGPKIVAEAVHKYTAPSDVTKIKILDVGAGTGLVAAHLQEYGFTNFDAVEPATGMTEILISKNVYGRVIQDYIGDHQIDIEDNTYDVVTLSGAFMPNSIPTSGVKELVRFLKPGGILVNCMREEFLEDEWYTHFFFYKNVLSTDLR